jgi:hypothetical protein
VKLAEPNLLASAGFLYRRARSVRRCHATSQAGSNAPQKMTLLHEVTFNTGADRQSRAPNMEDRAVDACFTYGCFSVPMAPLFARRAAVLSVAIDESFIQQEPDFLIPRDSAQALAPALWTSEMVKIPRQPA